MIPNRDQGTLGSPQLLIYPVDRSGYYDGDVAVVCRNDGDDADAADLVSDLFPLGRGENFDHR